jgi:hypothetical protein
MRSVQGASRRPLAPFCAPAHQSDDADQHSPIGLVPHRALYLSVLSSLQTRRLQAGVGIRIEKPASTTNVRAPIGPALTVRSPGPLTMPGAGRVKLQRGEACDYPSRDHALRGHRNVCVRNRQNDLSDSRDALIAAMSKRLAGVWLEARRPRLPAAFSQPRIVPWVWGSLEPERA